jgi:hypothetical protein
VSRCGFFTTATILLVLAASSGCGDRGSFGSDGTLLERVATLGEGDEPLSGVRSVAFDSRGRAYVLSRDDHDGMPFVLGPNGELMNVLAEPGEGPGELARPNAIFLDALDSVFVWDAGTGRMSVFSPDAELVRRYALPIPAVGSSWRLGNGDWIHTSATDHGFPFRLVTAEGELLREWGDTIDYIAERNALPIRTPWIVGPGPEDTFWATSVSFRLEARQFDATGDELRRLEMSSDWYDPYGRHEITTPESPPQARITGVRETDEGLWIVGMGPDPDWPDALGDPIRVEGQDAWQIDDYGGLYDTFIELRDPATGELRARYRDDRYMTGMPGGDRSLVMTRHEDELGFVTIDVYRVRYEPGD